MSRVLTAGCATGCGDSAASGQFQAIGWGGCKRLNLEDFALAWSNEAADPREHRSGGPHRRVGYRSCFFMKRTASSRDSRKPLRSSWNTTMDWRWKSLSVAFLLSTRFRNTSP
jgi:hypothetical protein